MASSSSARNTERFHQKNVSLHRHDTMQQHRELLSQKLHFFDNQLEAPIQHPFRLESLLYLHQVENLDKLQNLVFREQQQILSCLKSLNHPNKGTTSLHHASIFLITLSLS